MPKFTATIEVIDKMEVMTAANLQDYLNRALRCLELETLLFNLLGQGPGIVPRITVVEVRKE